ncbi:MAG: hypothetical protein H6838_19580 [Planctomycetes bacterium]|nr:hypothetical protein [Planctomycetota bacterium]MCB9887700.1 hypothetical protein [Planctomycetota bacterium]
MIMLLSSRGKARRSKSSPSFLGSLSQVVSGLFGSKQSGSRSSQGRSGSSGQAVPGWLALGAALLCFGAGFLVGGKFGSKDAPDAGLRAGVEDRKPGVIGEEEFRKLSATSFVVSGYTDSDEAVALDKARALALWLRNAGLPKARPYLRSTPKATLWTVVVYYDGEAEAGVTRSRLRALKDVPDEAFEQLRRDLQEKGPEGWPMLMSIQ